MMNFWRYYRAEFYKHKHTIFYPIHFILPIVLVLGFTLLFYTRRQQVEGSHLVLYFFEAISLALPMVISIICGFVSSQEEGSGGHQNILKAPDRPVALLAGITMLLTMCAFSIIISSILMFFSMKYVLGVNAIYILVFFKMICLLFLSIILVYGCYICIGFLFGTGVCCIAGFLGFMVAALGQTGLGDQVWYFLPPSWAIRLIDMIFTPLIYPDYEFGMRLEYKIVLPIMIISTLLFYIGMLVWIHRWQGGKKHE